MEPLELKMRFLKNSLDAVNRKLDSPEEQMSELENITETLQIEAQRKMEEQQTEP